MKEVPCMYRLKPICGLQMRVELPKCMYRLRQIQGSFDPLDVMHNNILAKSAVIEEQDKLPAVETLEQRQEAILCQLRNLKSQVEELSRQLRVPPSISTRRPDDNCMIYPVQEEPRNELIQVVVKASPRRIPNSLLAAIQCSCGKDDSSKIKPGSIEVKWYRHSTVKDPVPSLPCISDQNCHPNVQLTFIWKDVVKGGVEFCIGNSSSWLRGEALLMRVLMHHLPSRGATIQKSIISDVALSALLDSCTAISELTESSPSSLKQALSEADKWASFPDVIPSSCHSMSTGEIVLWGALKGLKGNDGSLPRETPGKLAAWFTSYSNFLSCN